MNFASWIILLIIVVWIVFAVRSAFFRGDGNKSGCHDGSDCGKSQGHATRNAMALEDDAEKYRLPSVCAGCSKGSCSGCASAVRDVPTPTIRELKE